MMIYIVSVISIILLLTSTILLLWYNKQNTLKLWYISENLGDLLMEASFFKKHLEVVYGLETYYGDETLEQLLTHVGGFIEQIEKFENIYSIVDGELEIVEFIEEFIEEGEEGEEIDE